MTTSAEPERREGEAPSGMPTDEHDVAPLGTTEEDPDGEDRPRRGTEAMPGIPTGGEPPNAG
jgi:hypothetical protein